MDKIQKQKYLTELARSNQGEALKELFDEKIEELKDVTRLPAEHLEVQARANIMAIVKLKEILRILFLLKEEKSKTEKNQYM